MASYNSISHEETGSSTRIHDYAEYLSTTAKRRQPSPLKTLNPYLTYPNMISLGAGLPHPSTLPIEQLTATLQVEGQRDTVQVDKYSCANGLPPLAAALQYGNGLGHEALRQFFVEEVTRLHQPRYADWRVIASCGNTDGFDKAVGLFCNPGDGILMSQWTYPAAIEAVQSRGIHPYPVDMDAEGMLPEGLHTAVQAWARRYPDRRPLQVVYLIPTAQNPTGATMSLARRQAIYAAAQQLNLILIEDDPYYHLQFHNDDTEALLPSLLSLDTDGRVVRLDTFSKVLAPGMRLGWITAAAPLITLLQYHNEVTTQQPSGLSQALATHLLRDTWGQTGWQRHLIQLRADYRRKRDLMAQISARELTGLCEWTVPQAGMVFWFRLCLPDSVTTQPGHMQRVFERCIQEAVLLVPGWQFIVTDESDQAVSTPPANKADLAPYFRAAFSYETSEQIEEAVKRFARVLKTFHNAE